MNRRSQLGTGLAVLAVVLFAVPAFFPVQPMLTHDTGETAPAPPEELRQQGYEIVAYENLSERGQELYVATLESGGQYSVPVGTGAPAFPYPTDAELAATDDLRERVSAVGVVVERPPDADLPSADEGVPRASEGETRYDYLTTRTARPPLTALPSLLRLFAVVGGVFAVAVGGYRRVRP